jgi:hypothetical protein
MVIFSIRSKKIKTRLWPIKKKKREQTRPRYGVTCSHRQGVSAPVFLTEKPLTDSRNSKFKKNNPIMQPTNGISMKKLK